MTKENTTYEGDEKIPHELSGQSVSQSEVSGGLNPNIVTEALRRNNEKKGIRAFRRVLEEMRKTPDGERFLRGINGIRRVLGLEELEELPLIEDLWDFFT